jgi:hypothetical protein
MLVGVTELESVTSCMSSKRSNQLSYTPQPYARHSSLTPKLSRPGLAFVRRPARWRGELLNIACQQSLAKVSFSPSPILPEALLAVSVGLPVPRQHRRSMPGGGVRTAQAPRFSSRRPNAGRLLDCKPNGLALRVKILCNRWLEFHSGSRGRVASDGTLAEPVWLGPRICRGTLAEVKLSDGSAYSHARNTLELAEAIQLRRSDLLRLGVGDCAVDGPLDPTASRRRGGFPHLRRLDQHERHAGAEIRSFPKRRPVPSCASWPASCRGSILSHSTPARNRLRRVGRPGDGGGDRA